MIGEEDLKFDDVGKEKRESVMSDACGFLNSDKSSKQCLPV